MAKFTKAGVGSVLLATAAGVALVACGGGGGGGGADAGAPPPAGNGVLRVALTDAPACGLDEVNITVERVRAHQSSGANDNDAGWHDIVLATPRKVNLLDLQNGVLVDLGQTTLPAGQYTQMRLVLSGNGGTTAANYVVPTNGSMMPMAMDTPSAQQSGIKLIHGFTIEANKTTSLVLDFDACKSVVQRGNGSYALKPVIGIMPMTLTRIVGYVQTGLTGVTVSAQKGGVVLRATQPDANGFFALGPIDPANGPYDVVFAGKDLTTSVVPAVPVAAEQTTTLNASANAIAMPGSASAAASGKVTLNPTAATTPSVRALQTIGAVPAVEVASMNVTATGDYTLSLPTAAPRLLPYSSPLATPPVVQTDAAHAGKYKLQASATGYASQTGGEITVPQTGQNFTLVP